MKKRAVYRGLIVALLAALLMAATAVGALAASVDVTGRVSDPSTMDKWTTAFGSSVNSTVNAGGVFMDKSVFNAGAPDSPVSIADTKDNFLVALSAYATNKSIEGYEYIPTDTVLILDMSSSMRNDIDELAEAANAAIDRLLALNEHNRVSVVIYSGNTRNSLSVSADGATTVLMPLGRYEKAGANATYVNATSNNTAIEVSDGVSADVNFVTSERAYSTGTYIQDGVYEGMRQFLGADPIVQTGAMQGGTARLPIFVLMTDGNPTLGTLNYTGNNAKTDLGNNNAGLNNQGQVMAFLTQLTSTWAKEQVAEHYGRTPLFYTLGFNISAGSTAYSVMNPTAGNTTLNNYWSRLNSTNVGNTFTVGGFDVIKKEDTTNRDYVDQYFSASSGNLTTTFDQIVNRIILQSLYYPTFGRMDALDTSGYVEFIDDIGTFMEVRRILGVKIGNMLYTGAQFASRLTNTSGGLGTPTNPTALGDEFIRSVRDRLGIDDVNEARDLVAKAYDSKQLAYTSPTNYSNYIGWYADANGNYISHGRREDTSYPANAVSYNESYGMLGAALDTNMMYISIRIEKNLATGHEKVLWKIPATLIPVYSYEIEMSTAATADGKLNAGDEVRSVTTDRGDQNPIVLLFEVGLDDELTAFNFAEKMAEKRYAADANGNYYFYANAWDQAQFNEVQSGKTDVRPSQNLNAVAWFEPSLENERYYYTEDSLIYTDTNGTRYTGSTKPTDKDPDESESGYYYCHVIFEEVNGKWQVVESYEPISSKAIGEAVQEANSSNWYIPKGTMRRPVARMQQAKANNATETIDYSAYLTTEKNETTDVYYSDAILGNNGRLTVPAPRGLSISKTLDGTDTGVSFTFTITGTGVTFPNGSYPAQIVKNGIAAATTVTFANGSATVNLMHGERIDIANLPAGNYTVTETPVDHYTTTVAVNGGNATVGNTANVTVPAAGFVPVAYTNKHTPHGDLVIRKIVDSLVTPPPDAKFDVVVTLDDYVADTNTYPTSDGDTVTVDGNNQFKVTLEAYETITVQRLPVGTKIADVTEENLPKGYTLKERSIYPETATITANGEVEITVTNYYQPLPVESNVALNVTKQLEGRPWLATDSFSFTVDRRVNGEWVPVDNGTFSVTGPAAYNASALIADTYTAAGTYYYRVTENIPKDDDKLAGMVYSDISSIFAVDVADVNGQLTITEVRTLFDCDVDIVNNVWTVAANFVNTYTLPGTAEAKVNLRIQKQIVDANGNPIGAQAGLLNGYTFALFDEELRIATGTTDTNGVLTLTHDALDDVGVHRFVIRETGTTVNRPQIELTQGDIELFIKVTDDYDGTMTAVTYMKASDVSGAAANAQRYSAVTDADGNVTGFTQADNGEYVVYDGDKDAPTMSIVAKNENVVGQLVIEKKLSEDSATPPTVKKFKIYVTLGGDTQLAESYTTSKGTDVTVDANRQFMVELAPGEHITVHGLPHGIPVTVTEEEFLPTDPYSKVSISPESSVTISESAATHVIVTNEYQPKQTQGTVSLKVNKVLTGRDWMPGDTFTFAVDYFDSVSRTWMPLSANVAITAATADHVVDTALMGYAYTVAGDYHYRVTEVIPTVNPIPGVTYAKEPAYLTVSVEDNNGQLKIDEVHSTNCTVSEDNNGNKAVTANFENTYSAVGTAAVNLKLQKQIVDKNGQPVAEPLDGYQFTLYNESGNSIASGTTGNDGSLGLAINNLKALGVHRFVIKETGTSPNPKVQLTQGDIELFVKVKDNFNGTISAVTYMKASDVNGAAADAQKYSVTRGADGTYTVSEAAAGAYVEYNAANMTVKAVNKYVVGSLVIEKKLSDDSTTPPTTDTPKKFKIHVTLGGNTNLDGTYSTCKNTQVTVVNNQFTVELPVDDHVTVYELPVGTTVSVEEDPSSLIDGYSKDSITMPELSTITADGVVRVTVVNTYTTKPTTETVSFKVNKELDGRDWLDGDEFAFEIAQYNAQTQTWDTLSTPTITKATPDGAQQYTLTPNYTSAGTYYYRMKEVVPDVNPIPGMTYAEEEIHLAVTVVDSNGQLVIESIKTDKIDKCTITSQDITESTGVVRKEWTASATFTNKYALPSTAKTSVDIYVLKHVVNTDGKILSGHSLAGYQFELLDGTVVKAKGETNELGKLTLTLEGLNTVGKKNYTLREVNDQRPDIVYADPIEVTVTVTDTYDGKLSAKAMCGAVEITGTQPVKVDNVYKPVEAAANVQILKTVKNVTEELKRGPEDFVFSIKDAKGKEVALGKTDEQGMLTLTLEYDNVKAGDTFTYILAEKDMGEKDVQYSTATYELTVKIIAHEQTGTLSAVVTSNGAAVKEPFAFENIYGTEKVLEELPETGDDSSLMLWLLLAAASCGVLAMLVMRRKRSANG